MKSQEGGYDPAVGVNTGKVWFVTIVLMYVYSCVQTHVHTQVCIHVCMCVCMENRGQRSLMPSLRNATYLL